MQTLSPVVSGNFAERYAALVDISRVLTGILRPADLYEAIAARLGRALSLEALLVSLVDPAPDRATVVFRSGAGRVAKGETTYPASQCLAIRDRRPVLHLPGDPAAACTAAGMDARGRPAISAPVMRKGHVSAVLTALGPTGRVFDAGDLEFVAATADLLAVATAQTGAAPDARAELDALGPITQAMALLSVDEALEHTARAAHELSAADGTALWLVRSGGEIEVAHACGPYGPRRGEKLPLSHDLFRELAARTAPYPFDFRKEEKNGREESRRLTRGGTGVMLGLHAHDRVLGALVVGSREPRPFPDDTLDALCRLAALAAIAAGYSRLHEQITALSLLDPLTGVPNRRQLAMYLDKEFAAARRGRKLTILLFDIDGFDQYNKTNGRQAGDAVLRAFGEMLVTQTRAMNLAARFENDTFIVALADADRRAGFIHASRIARAAEAHPLVGPSGIHASVGIASYTPRMKTYEDLIAAAEKDLETRRTGGGRLTI